MRAKQPPSVVCIGGANMDVKCRIAGRTAMGSSNPGALRLSPGGVARNVAENLARIGHRAALISVVGRDAFGERLLAETAAAGVNVDAVLRAPGATGSYAAMLDRQGELIVAAADMAILERLTPRRLARHRTMLARADLLVADSNLPLATLAWLMALCADRRQALAIEAVSVPKAHALRRLLTARRPLYALFCNRNEAVALTGERQLRQAARHLHDRGVQRVCIGRGPRGLFVSDGESAATVAAARVRVVDVTGAGDAAVAGTLSGLLRGLKLAQAARCGQRLAALTLASARSAGARAPRAPAINNRGRARP